MFRRSLQKVRKRATTEGCRFRRKGKRILQWLLMAVAQVYNSPKRCRHSCTCFCSAITLFCLLYYWTYLALGLCTHFFRTARCGQDHSWRIRWWIRWPPTQISDCKNSSGILWKSFKTNELAVEFISDSVEFLYCVLTVRFLICCPGGVRGLIQNLK